MNEKAQSFITNIGVLCETWTVAYKNFLAQGLDVKEALVHTQGFMTAFIAGTTQNNKGEEKT